MPNDQETFPARCPRCDVRHDWPLSTAPCPSCGTAVKVVSTGSEIFTWIAITAIIATGGIAAGSAIVAVFRYDGLNSIVPGAVLYLMYGFFAAYVVATVAAMRARPLGRRHVEVMEPPFSRDTRVAFGLSLGATVLGAWSLVAILVGWMASAYSMHAAKSILIAGVLIGAAGATLTLRRHPYMQRTRPDREP